MSLHGLPQKTPTKRRQRTIDGVKYTAQVVYYYGEPAGFMLKKGDTKRFHNGHGFNDPFSVDEALKWAIKNL